MFDAFIADFQIASIPTEREMKLAQSKSMAECNLSFEPKLKEARAKLSQTYTEALKVKQEVEQMKNQLDSIATDRSLDSVVAVLQAETKKAEDESEMIAEQFSNGSLDPVQFVAQFEEKRILAHKRKVKAEKLMEILKQQDYNQGRNIGNRLPSVGRAPYPDVVGRGPPTVPYPDFGAAYPVLPPRAPPRFN
uniref:VPS37 C-terminal domain-containing protein n=1 Tax=Panagrolaimus sp. JU765 TaxID=591449 RepID=A0AC34QTR3_9BILA